MLKLRNHLLQGSKYLTDSIFTQPSNNVFSRGLDESYEPSHDTEDGQYEGYRGSDLPEGYTAYGQNCNAYEYNQYEYDNGESPVDDRPESKPCERLKSCCNDIGRLVQIILR